MEGLSFGNEGGLPRPNFMFTSAAAPLRIPKALTTAGGMRSWGWLISKLPSELEVLSQYGWQWPGKDGILVSVPLGLSTPVLVCRDLCDVKCDQRLCDRNIVVGCRTVPTSISPKASVSIRVPAAYKGNALVSIRAQRNFRRRDICFVSIRPFQRPLWIARTYHVGRRSKSSLDRRGVPGLETGKSLQRSRIGAQGARGAEDGARAGIVKADNCGECGGRASRGSMCQ